MENNNISNNIQDNDVNDINKKVNDFINLIKSKESSYSDEKILELVENFKKILAVNPQINMDNPSFNYKVFEKEIFSKYDTGFINDILNYNVEDSDLFKTQNFIDNSQKETMIKLYNYLIENNIYSSSNIQYIIKYFDKFESLFNILIRSDYKLNEVEKNNLELYINHISINMLIYKKDSIQINNIYDLQRYKDIIIENGFKKIEEESNINNIGKIVLFALFEDYTKRSELIKLSKNIYLQQRMRENNLLDENDKIIINIINTLQSNSLKDKTSARDLLKRSIIISQLSNNLFDKIRQYYQSRIDKKINITKKIVTENIKKDECQFKDYNGKRIPIIDMSNIYSNSEFIDYPCFLTTKLNDESTTGNRNNTTDGLTTNPDLWNSLNVSSTISCSLSSFFKDSFMGGQSRVMLGFYDLPPKSLIGMNRSDGGLSYGYNIVKPKMHNSFESPEQLIKYTTAGTLLGYNEVGIYRRNMNESSNGERIQPKYLMCTLQDGISSDVLEYASYFGIPIIIYDKELYKEQHKRLFEMYMSGTKQNFNKNDAYAILSLNNISEEEAIDLIMNYISKEKKDSEDFKKLVTDVKNVIIDYYINNPELISNCLEKIDAIANSYSQDKGNNRMVA